MQHARPAKLGRRALKAYLGAAIAFLATLGTALASDPETGEVILTAAEVTAVLGSTLTAFVGIYFAPNGEDPDPNSSTPDPLEEEVGAVRVLPADPPA